MRVDEVWIDPTGAGLNGQLVDVDLPWRKQDLFDLAVDDIAIDVDVGETVVGTQRLYLSDGIGESPPIPEANIIHQSRVRIDVQHLVPGSRKRLLCRPFLQAEGMRGRLNVPLDVRLFELELIGAYIKRADPGGDQDIRPQ